MRSIPKGAGTSPTNYRVIVLNLGGDLRQFRAHRAFDDAAKLAQFAGLIFKIVPRMGAFAKQRHRAHIGQIEAAQAERLPSVATLVGQNLAGTGDRRRRGGTP